MTADIWRTGHGRFFPGRPEQLELEPVRDYATPAATANGASFSPLARDVERLGARVDRHLAELDAIGARLATLKGAP